MASNPLLAIPVVAERVDSATDSAGLIQLRQSEVPRGRVGKLIYRLLHFRPQRVLKLDEPGSFFWSNIDGSTDLSRLSQKLAKRFAVDDASARKSVLMFTKTLMIKRLIQLKVPMPKDQKS